MPDISLAKNVGRQKTNISVDKLWEMEDANLL